MKKVTFYLLKHHNNYVENNFTYIEYYAYHLSVNKWRQGSKIFIVCENYIQAIKFDKMLWEYNNESFIPHNLIINNKYSNGLIEIYYFKYKINTLQSILINLSPICVNFFLTSMKL